MENQTKIQGVYLVGGLRFHRDESAFLRAVEEAFNGGIRLFQLRIKNELPDRDHLDLARRVRSLADRYDVTFVINDRPDIARLCQADGLHLGPADMSVQDARQIVGDMLIGRSSHNLEQARQALNEEIDYLSVGPVYETDCKEKPDQVVGTDLVLAVRELATVPIVAIGGITADNLRSVKKAGVGCIGLIREVMASNDIRRAAASMIRKFNQPLN